MKTENINEFGTSEVLPPDTRPVAPVTLTVKRIFFGLVLVYLFIYILPLGLRPIAYADEARYAEIPREMMASGDWVVPRLNGLRYFEKPPLGYWANALSMMAFGQNGFGLRFPSALAAGISALFIFLLIRRSAPDNRWAVFLAPFIFLTSLLVLVVACAAVLDTLVTMLITVALILFYFATQEPAGRKRNLYLALFGLSCGLAFLTKGFLAFAVPVITIGPFLLWEKRWKDLFRLPWIPLLVALLTALPWALAIHRRESDYWHYFFWVEHVQRFLSDKAQHEKPFWYFIPVFIGFCVPWTFLIPAGIRGMRQKTDLPRSLRRFAICWFVFPFLFFSASRGKLATYILPCIPPFAILLSFWLPAGLQQGRRKAFNITTGIFAVLALLAALALPVTQLVMPGEALFTSAENSKWILLTLVSGVAAALAIAALRIKDPARKLIYFCCMALPFYLVMPLILPHRVQATRSATPFLEEHAARVPEHGILVSDGSLVHATCWFFKRDDVYLIRIPGELTYGLSYEEARHRYLEVDAFARMIAENKGKVPVTILMRADRFEAYRPHLPVPGFLAVDERTPDHERLLFIQYL